VLLLATSANVNPSAPDQPAVAAPPAFAVPPTSVTYNLPDITPAARKQRPASRAERVTTRRATAHRVRHRPVVKAAKRKPAARAATRTHRATTHRIRHRAVPVRAGRAGTVVGFAYDQVHKRYKYGSAGPDTWDCSGLTAGAYARIGVRLPHKAAGQARRGHRIPRSAARPGDLVAWGSGHVGIYVGRGRVVHAPGAGRRVTVARVWGTPAFRRLG
jgi:cell wall-associated NlpC family hydrolase